MMDARVKYYRLEKWLDAQLAAFAYDEQGCPGFFHARRRECTRIKNDFQPWEQQTSDIIIGLMHHEHDKYGRLYSVIREKYNKDARLILIASVRDAMRKGTVEGMFT